MMTTAIYGVPVAPAALADEKGNAVVVQTVADIHSLERMLRPVGYIVLYAWQLTGLVSCCKLCKFV